jgi:F-type H+-transporting ATPase subunit delta
MSIQKIAGRYAKSLRELAKDKNVTAAIVSDMEGFSAAVTNKDLSLLIKSPIISPDKKRQVFKALFEGRINNLTYSFFDLIIKKGREEYLPEIAKEFIRQHKVASNIVTATLITATPATDEIIQKVKAEMKIKQIATGEIELITKVNPAIIGGFILEVEDNIYDASIKSKLAKVKKALLDNSYVKSL